MTETAQSQEKISRVLFVDDDINIINSLKRGLIQEKYTKLFASSAEEALKIISMDEIQVLVTDMRMPGMSGLELLKIVSKEQPHIVRIVLSGYAQLPQVLATINQVNIYKFIPKPWNMEEEFIPMIRDALEYYYASQNNTPLAGDSEKQIQLYQNIIKQKDARYEQLLADHNHLNQFHFELSKYIGNQLRTPHFSVLSAPEVSDQLILLEPPLELYISAYPLEIVQFTPEKLRSAISHLIDSSAQIPGKTAESAIDKIHSNEPTSLYPIKHINQTMTLEGHYDLFMTLQKLIINHLLRLKKYENFNISQLYDHESKSIIVQYECPGASCTTPPWNFQIALFMINDGHDALPGKFEVTRKNQILTLKSTFHCLQK